MKGSPGLSVRALVAALALSSCGGDGPVSPEEPAGDFSLSVGTNFLTLNAGASGSIPVTIVRNGMNDAISVSVEGLPTGVSAPGITIPAGSTSGTIGVTADTGASAVNAMLTVRATGGGVSTTASLPMTLASNATAGYTLSINPSAVSIAAGASGTATVTVTRSGGFAGAVNVTVTGLDASLTAAPLTIAASSTTGTLSITASSSATAGSKSLSVVGSATGLTDRTASLALTVTTTTPGSPSFTMTASPASVSMAPGESKSIAVSIERSGGFTGAVTVSVEGLSAGVTASPITIGSSSTTGSITLVAGASATTGSASLTVRGKGTDVSDRTAVVSMTITSTDPEDPEDPDLPGFTMTTSPATSLSVQTGGTGSILVEIERDGGFEGAVQVSATGLPTGVTVDPITIAAGAETGTLTVKANGAGATSASITVRATATGVTTQTKSLTLAITSAAAPAFTLSTSPTSSLSIVKGGTATIQVTIARSGGFTGEVTVAATPSLLPLDVTAAAIKIAPSATTGTITLTAKADAPTVSTPKAIKVVATAQGVETQEKSMTLTVGALPEFTLSTTASTASITPGGTASIVVKVVRTGGFSGNVTVRAEDLPSGVTATTSSISIGSSGTGTITLKADATAAATTKSITIRGTGTGVTEKTASVALTVAAAPSFTLHTSPTTLTVSPAFPKELNVSVVRGTGFTGSVAVTVEGLPTGVTATSATITSSQNGVNITVTATSSAKAGTYTLTVRGKAGTIEQTRSVSLTIPEAASYSLSISPNPIAIAPGGKASFTVNITRNAAMGTNPVTLTLKSAPSGVSLTAIGGNAVVPGNTYTFELQASSSATLGAGTITVQGSGTVGGIETASAAINVGAAALTVKLASPSVTAWQAYTTPNQILTITRPPNVNGPATVSIDNPPAGITLITDHVAQQQNTTYIAIKVGSQVPIRTLGYDLTIRVKLQGAADATANLELVVQGSTYTGSFTKTFRVFNTDNTKGDRCLVDIKITGTVTATIPSMVKGNTLTITVSHTGTKTAVSKTVGTTSCTYAEGTFSATESESYAFGVISYSTAGINDFPIVDKAFDVGTGSNVYRYFIGRPSSLTVSAKTLGDVDITIRYPTTAKSGYASGGDPVVENFYYTRVGQP